MRQTMIRYRTRFDLNLPAIHVFVDPTGIHYWAVASYPVFLVINAKGILVRRINGARTESQLSAIVAQYIK